VKSNITLVQPRKHAVHVAESSDPKYQWSFHDGFFDVTGADHIEISVSDAVGGGSPVMHIAVSRGGNDLAQMRICRIRGSVSIKDNRRKK